MELVYHLSLAALLIVCALMILLVLMQKPKQEGLGAAFGGGMTNEMFGAHTVTVLQKTTAGLAVAFFVLLCITVGSGSAIEAKKDKTNIQAPDPNQYEGLAIDPVSPAAESQPEKALEDDALDSQASSEEIAKLIGLDADEQSSGTSNLEAEEAGTSSEAKPSQDSTQDQVTTEQPAIDMEGEEDEQVDEVLESQDVSTGSLEASEPELTTEDEEQ